MITSTIRTTDAASEPVSLAEAQAFLRVSSSDDATEIGLLITAARQMVEDFTGRALISQTWKLIASEWPFVPRFGLSAVLEVPRTPLASITSIKYYPAAGGAQATLAGANYHAVTSTEPGLIVVADGVSLPDLAVRPDAVEIVFTAGASSAPAQLRHAVLLVLVHLYEQRAPVAPGSINELPLSLRHILESQRVGWMA